MKFTRNSVFYRYFRKFEGSIRVKYIEGVKEGVGDILSKESVYELRLRSNEKKKKERSVDALNDKYVWRLPEG